MTLSTQIATHFRAVHFGGNWTAVNMKDTLLGVTWQQAIAQVYSFNTIATLVYHMHYYVDSVLKVLEGGPLDAKDEYSFDHPPIHSAEDWDAFLKQVWSDTEKFAQKVEQLPETIWWELLADEKHGNYYRNIHGIIEHTHYHLGQIVLIKKILSREVDL